MKISLSNIGKRFNHDWVFRHIDYEFFSGKAYAITGPNGCGKSTLLQIIAGAIVPSEGKILYSSNDKNISPDKFYKHFSFTAPYLDLIEEFTLIEFLSFHLKFSRTDEFLNLNKIIDLIGLRQAANKQIRYFSNGMKQRVKLAQSLLCSKAIILLDEPCTNLDAEGYTLYNQLINDYCKTKLIIVSSNDSAEYEFCDNLISIIDF